MRRSIVIAGLMLAIATPFSAQAQPTDAALAETLYQQARALMDQKRYDEACQKFAESHRLDPATGTLLNLASCNEARGKLATAWVEFNEALTAARRDGRDDRVAFARERIAAIEPRLSRITINVPNESDVPGLEIRMDGVLIGRAAWGVPAPTDPGTHKFEVIAPDRKPWSQSIQLGAQADQQTIRIPALVPAPRAAEGGDPVTPGGPIVGPDRSVTERPTPTSVYITGGATVLLVIGAGVTGAVFLDKKSTYNEKNSDPASSPSDRESARDSARAWGVMNGAVTIGAVAGGALTAYLYLTRPEVKRSARVTPWMTDRGGGLTVSAPIF